MNLRLLPVQILRGGFEVARQPITLAGNTLNRRGGAKEWGPFLLFESVEAASKKAVGQMLSNDSLVEEARALRGKVNETRKASVTDHLARQRTGREAEQKDQKDDTGDIDLREVHLSQEQIDNTVAELAAVGARQRAEQAEAAVRDAERKAERQAKAKAAREAKAAQHKAAQVQANTQEDGKL